MPAKDYVFGQVVGSFISTPNTIEWWMGSKDFDEDSFFNKQSLV